MNALSNDLRRKILEHYEHIPEATYKSTSEHFDVGEASVSRLVRHFRETGNVAPNPSKPKCRHKIDLDWVYNKVKNGVDKILEEFVSEYELERNIKVSKTGIWKALKSLKMSHKKNSYSQGKRI